MISDTAPSLAFVATALIICNDEPAIQEITGCLDELAISAQQCEQVDAALRLINRKKFEAVIVDQDLITQQPSVFDLLRSSRSNRNAVSFAISPLSVRPLGTEARPGFIMKRPLSSAAVRKILKASFGMIIRERRRYFRCAIEVPVVLHGGELNNFECQMVDISEGGIALTTSIDLALGLSLTATFDLPGDSISHHMQCEVCWSDKNNRAGLQFRSLERKEQAALQEWLAQRFEYCMPERVLRIFREVAG
jgi:hypothetical protein